MCKYNVCRQIHERAQLNAAIARVNRVFEGKSGGLVVDYIGMMSELREALEQYS